MIRVALVGPADRAEIQRLAMRIEERGGEPVVLDPRGDPAIVVRGGRSAACGEDLSDLRGVYVADLGILPGVVRSPDGRVDAEATRLAGERSRRHLVAWNTLLDHLSRSALVVNPPSAHDLHSLKPFEVAVYERARLPVPRTVATTEPAAFTDLTARETTRWVTKGMVGGYTHTEPFEPPRAPGVAATLLRERPLLVQERIEGDNVRAFVVGGRTIGAAEVVPVGGSGVDSRRGENRVRRTELPPETARLAADVARRWGMTFAAVDFMRETGTGRFVLLECNSAPFFVAFEARTGLDVSGRLADHLLGGRRG